MKRLAKLLAVLLLSSTANAAQQLSYNGHLLTDSGNFHVGDTFAGQFSFNPDSPDLSAYQTPPNVSSPRIELSYLHKQSSSIAINKEPALLGNYKIEVHFENDFTLTQAMINGIGLNGRVAAGTYDMADISDSSNDPASINTTYTIMALFAQDTFTATDIETQNYQGIFDTDLQPVFYAFQIRSAGNVSIGSIDHYAIAAVPLPGAVWLFGSAFAGLAWRSRRSA